MILLDGKKTSNDIKDEIAKEVLDIIRKGGKKPHLAAILVGNNGASETYVNAKVKACEKVGFDSTLVRLPYDVSEEELITNIHQINENKFIDGLIVQLPLPDHIDEKKIITDKNNFIKFALSPIKKLISIAEKTPFSPINLEQLSLFDSDNILNNKILGFNYINIKPKKVISAIKKSL